MTRPLSAPADISFRKGYTMLLDEGKNPKPRPEIEGGMLKLSDIRTAGSIMQPRSGNGMTGEAEAHVAALADAIRSRKDHLLDPILVWWSGRHWKVVDGHHRLVAYRQVSNPEQAGATRRHIPIDRVPVVVFDGVLHEAIRRAREENSKDKLRMSKRDKLEQAWRLTALGTMTIPEVAGACCVSERTVSNMRKIVSELTETGPGDFGPQVDPLEITWAEAKSRTSDQPPIDDAWIERQAQDWARRLGRTFGDKLSKNPGMALRALELYSEALPKRLVELWREEASKDGEDLED